MSIHVPIMRQEILSALDVQDGRVYIDATFGAGGHSKAILEKNAAVLAFDKDINAIESAKELQQAYKDRFVLKHTSYEKIESMWLDYVYPMKVDGIILDLGFSSDQIEDAERGFSFMKNGDLDMRYCQDYGISAKEWINTASKEEMIQVFVDYGQEKNASKIAAAIIKHRKKNVIATTFDLVDLINLHNSWDGKHAATRVFQAIRIHINQEFANIYKVLHASKKILKEYGRLAILTFHSLEDKIVKDFFENEVSFLLPVSSQEIEENARSRSAKLRWMIKTDMN